ncbi:MAG: MBL fold metallo-hydrolase [Dysgonamonadaceae bacterium]|jgi:glyoxylase-like metal-dependent hydrolase (beta-lactamase superfamily II)|nr:MBL fold metallo-hydrolase [Dysgonamonadaceae bacterium]
MIQYRILPAGFFYADGGAMFSAVPKRAWNRKYPSDEQNDCILAMNCVLAWNDSRIVLLDTGVGSKDLGKLAYYRFFDLKDMVDGVRFYGFEPEQITDVVLSHLHFDHCGGCTRKDASGKLTITFPNAIHYVGKKQWENYLHPHALEKDSFRPEDMILVEESGLLRKIEQDFELFPDFRIELYDGHTPGQLVSFFTSGEKQILFPGDVIPTHAHLSDEWISAYDVHPQDSFNAKRKMKERIKNKPTLLIFYHDAYFVNSHKNNVQLL